MKDIGRELQREFNQTWGKRVLYSPTHPEPGEDVTLSVFLSQDEGETFKADTIQEAFALAEAFMQERVSGQ